MVKAAGVLLASLSQRPLYGSSLRAGVRPARDHSVASRMPLESAVILTHVNAKSWAYGCFIHTRIVREQMDRSPLRGPLRVI